MSIVRPVRLVLFEQHLGSAAWLDLHATAKQRGRRPEAQLIEWLRHAAWEHHLGHDVELSQAQLEELLTLKPPTDAEAVA